MTDWIDRPHTESAVIRFFRAASLGFLALFLPMFSPCAAGNDILLITKGPALNADVADWAISSARKEVENGTISKARIVTSYQRILALKRELINRRRAIRAQN